MTPADAMFNDVTLNAIEQANTLLKFLSERTYDDWENVLKNHLSERELEINLRNVTEALERLGFERPVGAVVGGTGLAKAEAGLEGEDSQRAVRLLKQTGRLLQAGKGRGKALLILDATPLEAKDFAAAVARAGVPDPAPAVVKPVVQERPDDFVAINDVPNLLRAANNAHRDLVGRFEELARERKAHEQEITELRTTVDARDAEIATLKEEIDRRSRLAEATTWT